MKNRTLIMLISLVSIMCALTACGSSGGSGSAATPAATLAKDATVTVSFDSGNASGKAYKISSSTNYIQLYVTQWQASNDGLNTLSVVNTDTSHTLTPSSPSATLTLYSTYTRICASQYSSTPSSSTAPIEASCSFGILNSGNNTVTLTMLTDQWTLSQSYSSYGISSLVLSYPNISATASGAVYGVYDGSLSDYNAKNSPGQSINNWGSDYQLQVKDSSGNIITGFSQERAGASTHFNYGDNGPSIGGILKVSSTASSGSTNIFIGGTGRGVGSNGFITETKNVIVYPPNSTIPVITYPTSSVEVQDNKGNIVTSTVLANCELQVLSGSSIQGCGITTIKNSDGTDNSSSDIQKGTATNYNYMVTSTASVAGADICYTNNAGAAINSSGNLICYDYDMITSSSGGITCPGSGTYNNSRCEYTLSSTCTNSLKSGNLKSNTTYDATSQSCTSTGVGYYLNLNSTALTWTAN